MIFKFAMIFFFVHCILLVFLKFDIKTDTWTGF